MNETLVRQICAKVTQNIKPVQYLMEKLGVSKESAYRRMRGDIPFTFEELSILATNLDFSLDEIINHNRENRIFIDLQGNCFSESEESFLAMYKEYLKYAQQVSNDRNSETIASMNRLSLFFLTKYESLFKLYFYKWMHQTNPMSINNSFSETVIPTRVQTLKREYIETINNLSNIEFIIDRNIFLAIVREIQYYYSRKLLSDSDIVVLKKELLELINEMGKLMQNGKSDSDVNYKFYLSLLDIETNSTWSSFDNSSGSIFWLYSVNSVYLYDTKVTQMHRKWFDSLKKYSVLITQSNELAQVNFIDKQREEVENITESLLSYI